MLAHARKTWIPIIFLFRCSVQAFSRTIYLSHFVPQTKLILANAKNLPLSQWTCGSLRSKLIPLTLWSSHSLMANSSKPHVLTHISLIVALGVVAKMCSLKRHRVLLKRGGGGYQCHVWVIKLDNYDFWCKIGPGMGLKLTRFLQFLVLYVWGNFCTKSGA